MPTRLPISHDFGIEDDQTPVLVEFAPSVAPASPSFLEDRQLRLTDNCKLKILPGDATRDAQPASAASTVSRQFLEVVSEDKRKLDTVLESIEKEFAEEVVTILPAPSAIPAIAPQSEVSEQDSLPTPGFHPYQGYSGAAPSGLGFSEVAMLEGADGAGITVIDLEAGWTLAHEALRSVKFNLWAGVASTHSGWVEHGTAVSSLMLSARDGIGISGLVPGARGALASIYNGDPSRQRIAQQIDTCRGLLSPGDVLLVEVQRPGPTTGFQSSADQEGYLPTSFWPDVKESIRACVAAGIVVVEVAGNGGVDLGSDEFQGAFDQTGSTLTTLGPSDSGSILVGAGHAPGHEQAARSHIGFSNYGDRLDCQAWGESVIAAGYGEIWGAPGSDNAYTGNFFGTSSAAPLVAAAAVSVQGRHLAKYGTPVSPLLVRQLFASLGSTQQQTTDAAAASARIGPQPDLVQIFAALGLL